MQNHLEISSKYNFWTRNVRNWSKLSYGKLTEIWRKVYGNPRPVQEDLYGPIWAHMGPYGPTWAHIWAHIWAHMGPNPDRAPTRTGPQPGPGPPTFDFVPHDSLSIIYWGSHLAVPGWGPVRVGAQSGLGPGPGWGPYGPIGPLWAHKGPYGPIRAQFRLKN